MAHLIKNISLCILLILGLTFTGCNTLDIDNLTDYDANSVWGDEKLASAYVTNLYANVFGNWNAAADNNSEQQAGIPFYEGTITLVGSSYKKWTYNFVRQINVAIQELEKGKLSEKAKNSLLGEVYFMRAYVYMQMVIHHGGVPYITIPQDKDKDDLYVKRTPTAECFGLMIDDIDKAISNLPEKNLASSANYGRIDQCFAKAYKAKILLYKASPQFNPKNPYTNKYWEEAYLAAKDAYEFTIKHGASLTEKYDNIWLIEQGSEVIFPVVNSNPDKVAYWEPAIRPQTLSRNPPAATPTWNLIKSFPMSDGKMFDDPTGKYYIGSENNLLQCFWKNRDPRFMNTILFNGDLYPVAGTKQGYRQYTALGIASHDDAYGTNPNANTNSINMDKCTGLFIRKASDLSLTQDKVVTYDKDYILMRFAEVMMIYAEAANETGHSDISIEMLKLIRKRAGIEEGNDKLYGLKIRSKEEIRSAILNERNIEFCFEGHRFWDLRRTRNLMQLNKLHKYGVEAIAINPDGSDMDLNIAKEKAEQFELTPDDFRYVVHSAPLNDVGEREFFIEESFYFFPIQQVNIDENPNLEQNSSWGGTFNPALE